MSLHNSTSLDSNRNDLTLLFISRITRSFAAGALAVGVPLYYANSLHFSYLLIGILFATSAFAAPVLSYLFGILGDKYGRKKTMLIALILLPVAVIILLSTTYYPFLLFATALGGFGIAGGIVGGGIAGYVAPMQTALLAEKTKNESRTTVYTAFTMFANFTGSFGALTTFINNYVDIFYIALLFTILSFCSILMLNENFKPQKNKEKFSQERSQVLLQDKSIIHKFVITGIFNGMSQGLVNPFIAIILSNNFKLSNGDVGTIIALGGITTTIAMIGTPYLTKKLGFVNYIMISRTISAFFVFLFPFAPSVIMAVIYYCIFTITRAIALPSQQALMMTLISERIRSEASGTNQAARLIPLASSTVFSGAILDYTPLYIPFTIACIIGIVNVFLYQKFFGEISINKEKSKISVTSGLSS